MNRKKLALNFSGQQLTAFPSEIFTCKRLCNLSLSNNKIKAIPKEIEQLKHLETLDLAGNEIRQLHARLFMLPKLKILILNNNRIINIPKQMGNLQNLRILGMAKNKLKTIPVELSILSSLRELNLNENLIDDLPDFGKEAFPLLKKLWLARNPLKELTVENLWQRLPKLKALYLYSSKPDNPLSPHDGHILSGAATMGNCLPQIKTNEIMVKVLEGARQELMHKLDINEENMATVAPPVAFEAHLPSIFICYSHQDVEYLNRLSVHLKALQKKGVDLHIWDDRKLKS